MSPGSQSKDVAVARPSSAERKNADRRNNFDALRLIAAAAVVFSHSFLIAEGTQDHEPLIWLTGNQSILGLVGVFVFFAISGFLVTQSFEETGDAWRFLAKRMLRIFPGLFVATLLSAFRAGAARHTLPLGSYLMRAEPYEYVVGNTLLDQTVHELPGARFVDNQVGLEVNGSLWTLRYEFVMYLMVLALGVLRLLTVRVALLLVVFGVANLRLNMLDELEKWGWFFALLSNWGWLVGSLPPVWSFTSCATPASSTAALRSWHWPVSSSACRCISSWCCSRYLAAIWRCGWRSPRACR